MKKTLLISMLALLLISSVTYSSELSADEILERVSNVREADTVQITFEMELYGARGGIRSRTLRLMAKRGEEGEEKSLIRFLSPVDIEGTGFLSLSENGDEDMYLYLPALNNVRRIVSGQRSDRFMETDFTFNDLGLFSANNYTDDYQAELVAEDKEVYELKIIPIKEDIDYAFAMMHIRKEDFFPFLFEFYNEDGDLEKRMENNDVKNINGNLIAEEIIMQDLKRGSKTILYLSDVIYNQEIDDNIFTTRYLRRY